VPISGKPEIGAANPDSMTTAREYGFLVGVLRTRPGMTP
jgi:hypothetical protein